MRNQSKFETKIKKKLDKISKTVESLKEEKIVVDDGKGKGKHNKSAVFHHVCFGSFI
jgi:hypothetical protein